MSKNVLICDDDEGIVDVASIVLEEAGYEVHTVNNSEHLIEEVKKHKPSLILLDLWMPHLSGEEGTKLLKSDPETKDIPIIIVSASKNTAEVAQKSGANGFLCKPFDIEELEDAVAKYTNNE